MWRLHPIYDANFPLHEVSLTIEPHCNLNWQGGRERRRGKGAINTKGNGRLKDQGP